MKARRLLITGSGGFVGSWIARAAVRENFEVHGMVRSAQAPDRLRDLAEAVTVHEGDLADSARVTELVSELRPELVVHAAFPARHAVDEAGRRDMFASGVGGAVNLLEAIRSAGTVENFVHVGSAMVYGPSIHPHSATDALAPVNFRGACKAAISILCRQFSEERRTKYSEVRIFRAYGPWEQSDRLLPQLLRAALVGKTVQLTARSRSDNWIYVEDAAEACLAALNSSGREGVTINACTEGMISAHEVARLVEAITDRKLIGGFDFPDVADRRVDTADGALPESTSRISWRPRRLLAEGLQETWRWAQTIEGRRHLGVE